MENIDSYEDMLVEEDNLSSVDDLADEVEDTLDDVLSGESIKDGDLIDSLIDNDEGFDNLDPESKQIGITTDEDGDKIDECGDECECDDDEDDEEITIDDAEDDEESVELKESFDTFTVDAIVEAMIE